MINEVKSCKIIKVSPRKMFKTCGTIEIEVPDIPDSLKMKSIERVCQLIIDGDLVISATEISMNGSVGLQYSSDSMELQQKLKSLESRCGDKEAENFKLREKIKKLQSVVDFASASIKDLHENSTAGQERVARQREAYVRKFGYKDLNPL